MSHSQHSLKLSKRRLVWGGDREAGGNRKGEPPLTEDKPRELLLGLSYLSLCTHCWGLLGRVVLIRCWMLGCLGSAAKKEWGWGGRQALVHILFHLLRELRPFLSGFFSIPCLLLSGQSIPLEQLPNFTSPPLVQLHRSSLLSANFPFFLHKRLQT